MRWLIGIGGLLALLTAGVPAHAEFPWFSRDRVTAPWCLAHSNRSGQVECSFASFQQCQETRLGVGGSCEPNPAYRVRAERRHAKRHHRRHYR